MKPKIAVITYEAKGSYVADGIADEDELLKNILDELNLDHAFEIWSDQTVDWAKYKVIMLKSPWDYFDRFEEFKDWCTKISNLKIPMINSIDTVLWNTDKHYLKEIEAAGYSIVQTFFLEKGSSFMGFEEFFDLFQTDSLIIKPTISGGAKNTFSVNERNCAEVVSKVEDLLKFESFIIQPFIDEVVNVGEYSYIFFNGVFSHAVLKSAKSGDFRVQHFYGGQISNVQPDGVQLKYLQGLVNDFAKGTLYARVDGVWRGGEFLLMELELIEPYLFLCKSESGLTNYKSAIEDCLASLSDFRIPKI
ncbi:glutathione synthetase [Belliella sp. DSM 107340]|uniref:Glutathione synthetase n=1 Tax=Belliella calami TaxID=2923436 RepID=A0ABS9USA9_9BACT|nr:glutathione synthetase [Belliella calami]MCH7399517.1 glutathione synthetase [Belliella calami]